MSPETAPLWPVVVYSGCVLAVVCGMVGVSYVLGQRHNERATGEVYESGMLPTGTAQARFASDFFRIAIFFVVFDLESVFIYIWATAARELGWLGYAQISIFIVLLLAALVYLWRERALDM